MNCLQENGIFNIMVLLGLTGKDMGAAQEFDVIVAGAGASGLLCALTAAERGRRVLVLEADRNPGRKIRISGGGKCNVTNRDMDPGHFVSGNPHFCRSALSRFGSRDILDLLAGGGIDFEERDHGRIFSGGDAERIVRYLESLCLQQGVRIDRGRPVERIEALPGGKGFYLFSGEERFQAESAVVATGGAARPLLGGNGFGYRTAREFGLNVVPPKPALTPLLWSKEDRERYGALSGISLEVALTVGTGAGARRYADALLFTHRGLSGPAALQASLRWNPGTLLEIDLLPSTDIGAFLSERRRISPKALTGTLLSRVLPSRLAGCLFSGAAFTRGPVAQLTAAAAEEIARTVHRWNPAPASAGGYDIAEVTGGGVDVNGISSKSFEAVTVKGLFFTGEVLDVTGELGGYNLHWAWASGYCAGCHA